MNFSQFKEYVVIPALQELEPLIPLTQESIDLLMMTAAHESSGCEYLAQIGGPALGVFQMEPNTFDDIQDNFLKYRPELRKLVNGVQGSDVYPEAMTGNMFYAVVMARVHYFRVPVPLPSRPAISTCMNKEHQEELYLWKLAEYAKQYYNTPEGKATTEKYYDDYLEWRGHGL